MYKDQDLPSETFHVNPLSLICVSLLCVPHSLATLISVICIPGTYSNHTVPIQAELATEHTVAIHVEVAT